MGETWPSDYPEYLVVDDGGRVVYNCVLSLSSRMVMLLVLISQGYKRVNRSSGSKTAGCDFPAFTMAWVFTGSSKSLITGIKD